jgi:hypothetical protein
MSVGPWKTQPSERKESYERLVITGKDGES